MGLSKMSEFFAMSVVVFTNGLIYYIITNDCALQYQIRSRDAPGMFLGELFMRKKTIAVFLTMIMCFSLFAANVSAGGPTPSGKVTGLKWDADTFTASWNAFPDAQTYFVSLYKNGDSILDAYSASQPGYVGNVTTYDFEDMIVANGAGNYTFSVGAYINSAQDLTDTMSDMSDGKLYSVPVYDIKVTTDDYKMGRVVAKNGSSEVETASEGVNITLFAEASRGYRFVEWQSSDVDATSGSFKMPAKNVNVKAVFKEFPAVSGLAWDTDSFEGSWNAYTGATKYDVVLYKDGAMVKDPSTKSALPGEIGTATSYDFTDLIKANGDGDYKFTVAAYIDNEQDLNDSISDMSEAKKYDAVPNVTGVAWDKDSFKGTWDAYTGATKFFVSLYKDGKRINNEYGAAQPGYVGDVTSYDFSTLISQNGEGAYSFEVSAFITETADLTATMSERSTDKNYSLAKYTVTVKTEGGNYFCMASSNPLSADKGENITLSATPGMGYHFVEWKSSDVDASSGSFKMPEKDVTVTAVFAKDDPDRYIVSFNMNGHGTAIDSQSVEEGHTALEPTKPTESGWIFEGWYSDSGFTSEFDFTKVITESTTVFAKWTAEIVYTPDNSDVQTWEKGSNKSLDYVFHRSEDDSKTFGLFKGIQIDDKDVSADNYDAASGSLILKIKASYLETLAAGKHKLTVIFADGRVTVEFQIKLVPAPDPAPGGNTPKTGDTGIMIYVVGMIVSAGALGVLALTKKKKEEI